MKIVPDHKVAGPDAVRDGRNEPIGWVPVPAGDPVPPSAAARDLACLLAEVGAPGAVRAARVDELRAAVAAGRYRVDATAVARSVLRELLGDHVR